LVELKIREPLGLVTAGVKQAATTEVEPVTFSRFSMTMVSQPLMGVGR